MSPSSAPYTLLQNSVNYFANTRTSAGAPEPEEIQARTVARIGYPVKSAAAARQGEQGLSTISQTAMILEMWGWSHVCGYWRTVFPKSGSDR